MHVQKRNRLPNLDEILHVGRDGMDLWHNHLWKFWWRSVKRLGWQGVKLWYFA